MSIILQWDNQRGHADDWQFPATKKRKNIKIQKNLSSKTEKPAWLQFYPKTYRLNDKILRKNSTGSSWEIIRNLFPQEIRYGSFPAVKIGRLAVSKSFQYKNIGSKLLSFIKIDLLKSPRSAFRFLTVDAYSDAVGFYERNGFVEMQPGRNGQTSIMYFDMAKLR